MSDIFFNAGITCVVGVVFTFVYTAMCMLNNKDFDAKEEIKNSWFLYCMNILSKISFYGMFIFFIGWVWA